MPRAAAAFSRILLASLFGTALGAGVLAEESHPEPAFRSDGTVKFVSGDGVLLGSADVEVPQTFSTFMRGLMWRKSLTDQQAMLFRWRQDGPIGFWMENTFVALDIVYANEGGTIVSIGQGRPLDLNSVPSGAPASVAVEVPAGWCQRHGVSVGDRIDFSMATADGFVADGRRAHFGASPEEVDRAVADGTYLVKA
mmetsp:Transcript_26327/g.55908  ORF Transcript_26327/g.55908 Transcript_26327/m.55908 type:complete len:196 (-) Transcript_26327:52-639(-)